MLTVLGALVVLFAFVLVLGLHVSLRLTNSRLAIVNTLGTVFFLSVGTLITIYMVVINTGSFANQWLSFIAFLPSSRSPAAPQIRRVGSSPAASRISGTPRS